MAPQEETSGPTCVNPARSLDAPERRSPTNPRRTSTPTRPPAKTTGTSIPATLNACHSVSVSVVPATSWWSLSIIDVIVTPPTRSEYGASGRTQIGRTPIASSVIRGISSPVRASLPTASPRSCRAVCRGNVTTNERGNATLLELHSRWRRNRAAKPVRAARSTAVGSSPPSPASPSAPPRGETTRPRWSTRNRHSSSRSRRCSARIFSIFASTSARALASTSARARRAVSSEVSSEQKRSLIFTSSASTPERTASKVDCTSLRISPRISFRSATGEVWPASSLPALPGSG